MPGVQSVIPARPGGLSGTGELLSGLEKAQVTARDSAPHAKRDQQGLSVTPCQGANSAVGCVTRPPPSPQESTRPPKQAEAGPGRLAALGLLVGLAGSEQQDMVCVEADGWAPGGLCWPSGERGVRCHRSRCPGVLFRGGKMGSQSSLRDVWAQYGGHTQMTTGHGARLGSPEHSAAACVLLHLCP